MYLNMYYMILIKDLIKDGVIKNRTPFDDKSFIHN